MDELRRQKQASRFLLRKSPVFYLREPERMFNTVQSNYDLDKPHLIWRLRRIYGLRPKEIAAKFDTTFQAILQTVARVDRLEANLPAWRRDRNLIPYPEKADDWQYWVGHMLTAFADISTK